MFVRIRFRVYVETFAAMFSHFCDQHDCGLSNVSLSL
jgi:hypothetical protein